MLETVKSIVKIWHLQPELKGVDALVCCGAAAAQLRALGEPWTPYGVNRAYAEVRRLNHGTVWKNMEKALRNAGLPGPSETIRYLAAMADRIEGEAMSFQWGRR